MSAMEITFGAGTPVGVALRIVLVIAAAFRDRSL
jgi:hypothetical protein